MISGDETAKTVEGEDNICAYCASVLAIRAKVCPVCKYDQNVWKNRVLFFSGITSAIIIASSCVLFIGSHLSDFYYKNIAIETVGLHDFALNLQSTFEITLDNPNDEDIYVSSVSVTWPRGSANIEIGETIKSHNFLHKKDSAIVGKIDPLPTGVLATAAHANIDKIYKLSSFMSATDLIENNEQKQEFPCFFTQFRSSDSTDLEIMTKFYAKRGTNIVTDRAQGVVEFLSSRSSEKKKTEIELVVIFVQQTGTSRCKNLLLSSIQ